MGLTRCGVRYSLYQKIKSVGLTQKYTEYVNSMLNDINLKNNLGFSLYAIPSVCHVVVTSEK